MRVYDVNLLDVFCCDFCSVGGENVGEQNFVGEVFADICYRWIAASENEKLTDFLLTELKFDKKIELWIDKWVLLI